MGPRAQCRALVCLAVKTNICRADRGPPRLRFRPENNFGLHGASVIEYLGRVCPFAHRDRANSMANMDARRRWQKIYRPLSWCRMASEPQQYPATICAQFSAMQSSRGIRVDLLRAESTLVHPLNTVSVLSTPTDDPHFGVADYDHVYEHKFCALAYK